MMILSQKFKNHLARKTMFKTSLVLICFLKASLSLPMLREKPRIHTQKSNNFLALRENNRTVISDENFFITKLEANCSAPYPIQWNITGYISEPKFEYTRLPHEDTVSIYQIKTVLYDFSSYEYSLRLACESIEHPFLYDEVFIFHWQKDKSKSLVRPKSLRVTDSNTIPCPTLLPEVDVQLYLTTDSGEQNSVSGFDKTLKYYSTVGFVSENMFNGVYTCMQNISTVKITAVLTAFEEYKSFPSSSSIKSFHDQTIEVKCYSGSAHNLRIRVRQNFTWFFFLLSRSEYPKNNTFLNVVTLNTGEFIKASIRAHFPNQLFGVTGKATCVAIDSFNNSIKVVKEWNFEFVEAPVLHLNQELRRMECKSYKKLVLYILSCEEITKCTFCEQHWGRNITDCPFVTNLSPVSGFSKYPNIALSLNFVPFMNVAIAVVDGLPKKWVILETLNQRKYLSWMNAKTSELIQIEEVSGLDGNKTSIFLCETLKYLFPKTPKFHIKFKNQSVVPLSPQQFIYNVSNMEKSDKNIRLIEHLNIITILEIELPKDAVELQCVAQWWNSTEQFLVSKKVQPRNVMKNYMPITSNKTIYISISVVGGIVVFALLTALVVFIRRNRKAKEELRNLTKSEIDEFFEGKPGMIESGASADTIDFLPFNKHYEIALAYSETSLLGTGEFAFVVRGLMISSGKAVAIKMPKPSTNIELFKSLLSEAKIMSYIGHHDNILSLIAVCTEEIKCRSIYIVTNICALGSLQNFLRNCRPQFVNSVTASNEIDVKLKPQSGNASQHVTTFNLIKFASQIANGMDYLASKLVVHADLATRNILLTSDKTIKISDFGLSKKLYESTHYIKKSKTPLPWRWMALESLETLTFSTKSDIWAYGVTLYEIFTLGNVPFPNEQWSHKFVTQLKDGMRMECPEFSTQDIYSKMLSCWNNSPDQRPEFGILHDFFEELCQKHCETITHNSAV